jgi:SAM-dependent methyltransferase
VLAVVKAMRHPALKDAFEDQLEAIRRGRRARSSTSKASDGSGEIESDDRVDDEDVPMENDPIDSMMDDDAGEGNDDTVSGDVDESASKDDGGDDDNVLGAVGSKPTRPRIQFDTSLAPELESMWRIERELLGPDGIGTCFLEASLITDYDAQFDRRLEELKAYVANKNNLPPCLEKPLGKWVTTRRHEYKKGKLSAYRIAALEAVPYWTWDGMDDMFPEKLETLKAYVADENRLPRYSEQPLGTWVCNRRKDYKKGKLSADRITALEAVPFWSWDGVDDTFPEKLEALKAYVAEEEQLPPRSEKRLGKWINRFRQAYKNGKLSGDRIAALEAVPYWTWDGKEDTFPELLEALKAYVAEEEQLPPRSEKPLGQWVTSRRQDYKKGKLSADRITALEAVPYWTWDGVDDTFPEKLRALMAYVIDEKRLPPRNSPLGSWIHSRRGEYKKGGKLSADRITALEAVPFWSWDAREDTFLETLEALKAYVTEQNKLPLWSEKPLGQWINRLRQGYKKGKLSKYRITALEAVPHWTWTGVRGGPRKSPQTDSTTAPPRASTAAVPTRPVLGEFSELVRKYHTQSPDTTRSEFAEDPSRFREFHVAAEKSEAAWPTKPLDMVVDRLKRFALGKRRRYLVVADLGCGKARLAQRVRDDPTMAEVYDVRSFDLYADSPDVVAADARDLGALQEDCSVSVAVLCMSMWGNRKNVDAYLHEAYRILETDNRLLIVEPTRRWMDRDDEERTNQLERAVREFRAAGESGMFEVAVSRWDTSNEDDDRVEKFTYIEAIKRLV